MKIIILFLFIWISDVFGQDSIIGSWKAYSLDFDGNDSKEIKISDRYQKVYLTFNLNGFYTKSYYVPEKNMNLPLYLDYEIKNGELIKKQILDENGYYLKMLIVKEKIENGTYIIDQDSIIFVNDNKKYKLAYNITENNLVITEKIDDQNLYIRLILQKKKKSGSS